MLKKENVNMIEAFFKATVDAITKEERSRSIGLTAR